MNLPGGKASAAGAARGWSLLEILAAIVVAGIGIALFGKVNKASSRDRSTNSRILIAGKLVEKHIEDTRIAIAKNPTTNWPPRNRTVSPVAPHFVTLTSTVGPAYSPKDRAVVLNVMRMDVVARWTTPKRDSLKVTTYVAKNF